MRVPSDLQRRIEDEAAAMGVDPKDVLRALIELGLGSDEERALDLVIAVEGVLERKPRVIRIPGLILRR